MTLTVTIIEAILPILVTLGLGYFAGYRRQFDPAQASVLIRMVMLYALPLSLFGAILGMDRAHVLAAGPVAAMVIVAMASSFLIAFALLRLATRMGTGECALFAFAISDPSVPFIGIPVLGQLFGAASAVPVSAGSLTLNLFQLPLTLILIGTDHGDPETRPGLWAHVLHSCREPVVWTPLLALVLVLCGVHLPPALKPSVGLLGHATGGAALFATGIVLYARRVRFDGLVAGVVFCRNMLIPGLTLLAAWLLHLTPHETQASVLTMSIPTASATVILAMRYGLREREAASILFFGTLTAIVTMAAFIWATGAAAPAS